MLAELTPRIVEKIEEALMTGMYNNEPLKASEFTALAKLAIDKTRVGGDPVQELQGTLEHLYMMRGQLDAVIDEKRERLELGADGAVTH